MVSCLRLVILDDNVGSPGLLNEWGWSVFIVGDEWVALFDADTDSKVIEYNAEKLGVDLGRLDYAFLSHHHGDHSGGFKYIGRLKPGLKIYVPPGDTWYLSSWGLKPVIVSEAMSVAEDAWSTGPLRSYSLYEHALAINVDNHGLVVIVGCSHPGVDNLTYRAREVSGISSVYLVMGGFHGPTHEELDNIAKVSKHIAPAHCSGEDAKEYVRRKYGDKYVGVRTGFILEIGDTSKCLL